MGIMSDAVSASLLRQTSTASLEQLTPRQLDVLALLCEGMPNKLIGRRLNIASGTVKVHVAHILRALNVASRLQAVLAARSLGLDLVRCDAETMRSATLTAPGHAAVLRLVSGGEDASRLPATVAGQALESVAG